MKTTITLPDGKRIVINENSDARIVEMVMNVIKKMEKQGIT